MSGHQEYKCPDCGYEWESLEPPDCPRCRNKPVRVNGILAPANHSFDAVNEFVHHPDVSYEELQWALLGMCEKKDITKPL